MAIKIRHQRNPTICRIYCICLLPSIQVSRYYSLECIVLDYHVICIHQCHQQEFRSRKSQPTTLLLLLSRPKGNYPRQSHLQHVIDDHLGHYRLFRLFDHIQKSPRGPHSIFHFRHFGQYQFCQCIYHDFGHQFKSGK